MEINRPFYIVSDLIFNRVATVYSSKNIVIQTRTDKKEQQWFFDEVSKTIKSVAFKDLSLDLRGGNLYAYKTDSKWYQLFKYVDGRFQCENYMSGKQNYVFEVSASGADTENRQVSRASKNNNQWQQWKILYVDEAKPEPTSGFAKHWGFWINRPFVLVS